MGYCLVQRPMSRYDGDILHLLPHPYMNNMEVFCKISNLGPSDFINFSIGCNGQILTLVHTLVVFYHHFLFLRSGENSCKV